MAPEKGVNAIYEMAEIIPHVEKRNLELIRGAGPRGTLVMSRISSVSASLNAVPSECEVYLDRRMVPGETEADIRAEMDESSGAKMRPGRWKHSAGGAGPAWISTYRPFHAAWRIDLDHELTRACRAAYQAYFGSAPVEYDFWDFSTNAVASVGLGIPTIGFGPGEHKLAHMGQRELPGERDR